MMNQNQGNNSTSEEEIKREIDKLDESNKKQEQRTRNLETKAVQNVNLYFIFQAVILASTTSAASSTTCRSWWIPFTLSLLAAVTNFFSFCVDMSNVLKSREELDQNWSDLAFMKMYKMTRTEVIQVLPGTPLNHEGGDVVRPKVAVVKKWKCRLMAYASVGMFVGFSAVVMYGCHAILCHPGHRKCVELC